MIVGVTGNRKLIHTEHQIAEEFDRLIALYQPTSVVTGMAVGFDQLVAERCIATNIPFTAAVPFVTQACLWPKHVQEHYLCLLDQAANVVVVTDGDYAAWKMFRRNEWIVDNSDVVLAYLQAGDGGTKNCVDYATKIGKPVEYILKPSLLVP